MLFFAAGGDGDNNSGIPSGVIIAVSVSVSSLLLLLLVILVCIFKQRGAKLREAAEVRRDDENPVYGVYFDPDPRMEFEDTNDNYSSDYEPVGTSRTTDNNPNYE